MKRLLLSLLVGVAALLLVEGALSLALNRSLTETLGAPRSARLAPRAVSRARPESQGTRGLYRVHPDPRVGYVLQADADLAIFDGQIRSDALGLRSRPLPARGPGALKLVVLGDSVAFGYGLDDDQTLAHRLELLLNAAAPGRPVECRTVAIPGWNHRNAVSCLLDHLDALAPDIVVYLPIPNDLLDSDGVEEGGKRRWLYDPSSHEPWLQVNQLASILFARRAAEALRAAGRDPWSTVGPDVVVSDLSPESHRRYDENAASIAQLARVLERRGAKLLLLQWKDDEYGWHLRRRLSERGLDLPVLPLFTIIPQALTLGFDPHPNAETVEGMAGWIAADLLARGWVAGDAARIPPASESVAAARAPDRPLAQVLAQANLFQWNAWTRLQPVIDFGTYAGAGQIFGGINVDGTAGARALFLLPRNDSTLTVRLAGLPSRPDLYPMDVAVQIDGRAAGALRIDGAAEVEARFAVPPQPAPAVPVEVQLIPQRYAMAQCADVGWQLVSFRPVRLQCGAPLPEGETASATRPPAGTRYPLR